MKIKDIIDKLSSYNLFNYLFPGFLFVVILKKTTSMLPCEIEFKVIDVTLIYFVGLVISRIGSLSIENILEKRKKIDKINTKTLFDRINQYSKVEIIHEAMNMYRTLAAGSGLLFLISIVDLMINKPQIGKCLLTMVLELLLFILFTYAFCKQRKKVNECLE